jgi:hypothetical protein
MARSTYSLVMREMVDYEEATEGREIVSLLARKRKMAENTPKTVSEAQIKASQPSKTLDKLLMEYESN